jgi:tRNA nucleotidyltransferase (CCA-adding enzyme)
MSDYMYLLESHVNQEQNRLLTEVQAAAIEAGVAIYLTGGAMRDMLGGFPITDLDFTFEEPGPAKLGKMVAKLLPDAEFEEHPVTKTVEIKMPGGATGSLRVAHVGTPTKAGAAPKVKNAPLLDDLHYRDFTINAIAISLARASRGLIRDPMNGQSDLHNHEIRMCYPSAFLDDPLRLLRAVRLRHRLNFTIEERTERYLNSAIEAGALAALKPSDWRRELEMISDENVPSEILRELDTRKLLPVSAESLNLEGLAKFEKLRRMIPGRSSYWPLFLLVLVDGVKPKDRAAFASAFGLKPAELEEAKKLKPQVTKLATAVKAPAVRRPSHIYNAISPAPPVAILYLLYDSDQRLILDRLRNYLEKYLPEASEITDAQVEATGAKPGSAQFARAKASMIAAKLNEPPPPPPLPPTGPMGSMAPGAPARVSR